MLSIFQICCVSCKSHPTSATRLRTSSKAGFIAYPFTSQCSDLVSMPRWTIFIFLKRSMLPTCIVHVFRQPCAPKKERRAIDRSIMYLQLRLCPQHLNAELEEGKSYGLRRPRTSCGNPMKVVLFTPRRHILSCLCQRFCKFRQPS